MGWTPDSKLDLRRSGRLDRRWDKGLDRKLEMGTDSAGEKQLLFQPEYECLYCLLPLRHSAENHLRTGEKPITGSPGPAGWVSPDLLALFRGRITAI
ncbi:hypothetical protein SRHO_G00275220 [Serrasalmus rhombeus]